MEIQKLKDQLQEKDQIIKKFQIYYLEKQIDERDLIIKDAHKELNEKKMVKGTCDDDVEFLWTQLQEKNRILQNLLIFFERHGQAIKTSLTEPQLKN